MKQYFAFTLLALVVALTYIRFAQASKEKKERESVLAQTETSQTELDAATKTRLRALLRPVGISIAESGAAFRSDSYRQLRIRWDAYPEGPEFVDPKDGKQPRSDFQVNSRRKDNGVLPQLRAVELSEDQMFVAAVNGAAELRAWALVPDPRLLRAEEPDATGRMKGRLAYRSRPEFFVNLPDDPEISEVRFYHPRWNGVEFNLEPLGSVPF